MNPKGLLTVLLVPAFVLLIPLVAMQFTGEVAWNTFDFIVAWVLMAGVGLAYLLVTRKAVTVAYRLGAGGALATAFSLIWINLAVGLIGSEENPANLLYAGVLAVGLIGAALARFEPLGMARALLATALAQFLVPVVALLIWRPDFSPGVVKVLVLNFGFVLLFAGSSLLFRHAASQRDERGRQSPA